MIWIVDQHPIYFQPGELPSLLQLWATDLNELIIISEKKIGKIAAGSL